MANCYSTEIVSCTNARSSDFKAAAKVFREAAKANHGVPEIADKVQFYIAAASVAENETAKDADDWQVLVNAGVQVMPSGCAQCIGLGSGLLQAGEVNRISLLLCRKTNPQSTGIFQQ